MLGRIVFCTVVAAAVLAVILLATVSPLPRRSSGHKAQTSPNLRRFTVYIHPTLSRTVQQQQQQQGQEVESTSALVFQHRMTEGPESTSRTVGMVSGFVLPGEGSSVLSVFDMVHLVFDADGLSGSLCVEAGAHGKAKKKAFLLRVAGGTGMFAFAHGNAVLRAVREKQLGGGTATALQLEFSVEFAES